MNEIASMIVSYLVVPVGVLAVTACAVLAMTNGRRK